MKSASTHAGRWGIFLYGCAAYAFFLVTLLYTIGFVAGFAVPKDINDGSAGPISQAILINGLFLSLFAIQHTIMARPAFKQWWTRIVPEAAERSTFVMVTCIILCTMFWQWRPMPEVVWNVSNEMGRFALYGLSALGWVTVLYASFCIDHFDLFGLRQVVLYLQGRDYHHPEFAMPWLYKLIRNPLMLGFLIAFWATPTMTQGHLFFAVMVTGYILVGIQFEERDLIKILGENYRGYRARTPMLLPWPRKRTNPQVNQPTAGLEMSNA